MSDLPDLTHFDRTNPDQFRAVYEYAGSAPAMERLLAGVGQQISASAINNWRKRYGIPIKDPGYRMRSETHTAATHAEYVAPEKAGEDERDTAAELLEWLQTRTTPVAPPPAAPAKGRQYARALVGCDIHFPYHHRGAFDLFCSLAARIQPEELVLAGDIFDWPMIGRYLKKPSEQRAFQDELDVCREEILAPLSAAAPLATRRFLVGNHESGRWERYLWERCPEISSLRALALPALLGLEEMGWVYQAHEWWPTDAVVVCHGWRHTNQLGGGSAASARKQFLDMGCSGVSGHTHHMGSYFRRDRSGYYTWCEAGCLCDWQAMQAAGVTSSSTPTRPEDWHIGALLCHYHPGGSAFRLELLPFLEEGGRTFCIIDGEDISV